MTHVCVQYGRVPINPETRRQTDEEPEEKAGRVCVMRPPVSASAATRIGYCQEGPGARRAGGIRLGAWAVAVRVPEDLEEGIRGP